MRRDQLVAILGIIPSLFLAFAIEIYKGATGASGIEAGIVFIPAYVALFVYLGVMFYIIEIRHGE